MTELSENDMKATINMNMCHQIITNTLKNNVKI